MKWNVRLHRAMGQKCQAVQLSDEGGVAPHVAHATAISLLEAGYTHVVVVAHRMDILAPMWWGGSMTAACASLVHPTMHELSQALADFPHAAILASDVEPRTLLALLTNEGRLLRDTVILQAVPMFPLREAHDYAGLLMDRIPSQRHGNLQSLVLSEIGRAHV